MAKKDKTKKEVETTPTPVETTNTTTEETVTNEVAEETVATTDETPIEETVEKVVEEKPKKESKKEKQTSFKDIFEAAIATTPYMIFQNSIMICRWKPNVSIECHEDGFTLNHVKYSYSGIEVKHI